jgi:hypothetical protein
LFLLHAEGGPYKRAKLEQATVALHVAARVSHLWAQLDRRAEEAARQAEADRELRVMLMQLERTNAELAASLCAKALPAPRVRRWQRVWGVR